MGDNASELRMLKRGATLDCRYHEIMPYSPICPKEELSSWHRSFEGRKRKKV